MGPQQTHPRLTCDGCGRSYAWTPQLGGRKVKCKCGHVMVAPERPEQPQADDELYDLSPAPTANSHDSNRMAPTPTIIRPETGPTLAYRRPDLADGDLVEMYFPDRVKDLYMPLALIAGGTVIELGQAVLRRGGIDQLFATIVGVGVYMIVNTVLMLVGIFIVAKLREISFGPLPTAVIKLCGISIGPGAFGGLVGAMLAWIPLGGLIGWLVAFVLYFALLGALFDLEESDTWWCVIIIFAVKVGAFLLVLPAILRLL
jgi:hypothetical protein